jgi:hypothetical protein
VQTCLEQKETKATKRGKKKDMRYMYGSNQRSRFHASAARRSLAPKKRSGDQGTFELLGALSRSVCDLNDGLYRLLVVTSTGKERSARQIAFSRRAPVQVRQVTHAQPSRH